MAINRASLGSLGAPRTESADSSMTVRYVEMLFEKVKSQEHPDPGLLDRIEKRLGLDTAPPSASGASPLIDRYFELLIDEAGAQVETKADLLDRIEKLVDVQESMARSSKGRGRKRPGAPGTARRVQQRTRRRRSSAGAGHPEVAPDEFRGMGPTDAYRKFVATYGDSYSVPQIRDALVSGGVNSASRTSLATGLHAVRRRDRIKAEAAKKEAEELAEKKARARAAAERAAAEMKFGPRRRV